jgi:hypothetical protein
MWAWLSFCATLLLVSPARAEPAATDFLKSLDGGDESGLVYLNGIAQGIDWTEALLEQSGRKRLYCGPEKLSFTPDQYASILREYVKRNPKAGGLPIGGAMLFAMIDTFPCSTERTR